MLTIYFLMVVASQFLVYKSKLCIFCLAIFIKLMVYFWQTHVLITILSSDGWWPPTFLDITVRICFVQKSLCCHFWISYTNNYFIDDLFFCWLAFTHFLFLKSKFVIVLFRGRYADIFVFLAKIIISFTIYYSDGWRSFMFCLEINVRICFGSKSLFIYFYSSCNHNYFVGN